MVAQKNKKIWIWIASIFGGLILIIAVLAIVLSSVWKPLLTEKIKDGVYKASNHLYKIDFKSINLNILTGSLSLQDVNFSPDSALFEQLKANHQAPARLFKIKLKKVQVSGVGILTAYFKKRIEVNAILLDNPSIHTSFNKAVRKKDRVKETRSLYEEISKSLKSIHVKSIKIVNADFEYINILKSSTSTHLIKHLNIRVKDFLLDSLSQNDSTRFYYTKDISFEVMGYKALTKDKMYTMGVDTVSGSIRSKEVHIRGFRLKPLYPELTFSRKYSVQKDRYDLTFNKIDLTGVDFIGFDADQKIQAKSLRIHSGKVAVFMSRESPPPPIDKGRNYPHVALQRLDIETIVDSVKLKGIDIFYSEYNPASRKIGTVAFNDLTGSILNVSNDSVQLSQNNHAIANLNTKLMGTGNLNLKINFNLSDKNGAFTYSGKMDQFNMQALNPLSKALGLIEIESGEIKHIDFEASANQRTATGRMHMLYNNLKIKMLSDNIDQKGTKKKRLLSFLANTFLVNDDNPKKGDAARTAQMKNTRINSASFFNLMWKTVFIGIKDIVGVGIIPEKNPVKQQKVIAKKINVQKQQHIKEKGKIKN